MNTINIETTHKITPDKAPDPRKTAITRRRYQRISRLYDLMETLSEKNYIPWREQLWSLVNGTKTLEVGVGTGKNLPYYPEKTKITGIDLTPGMLERARKRADKLGIDSKIILQLGDVQALEFPDASFDVAVATFVFCSVPDPILGLREMKRVVRSGGRILLLEHMRSPNPIVGKIMDLFNPLVVRMMGANINRLTVENVKKAGLVVDQVTDLSMGGIFKLIVARVA